MSNGFAADLERYGPWSAHAPAPTLDASRRYCRRLARRHYENFTVASRLVPAALRQHFANVYAFCRWADDLADETGGPSAAFRGLGPIELLDWWEAELDRCYDGQTSHPVFVALADTVRKYELPADLFRHLLSAFRQDQRLTRYATQDELLDYCRRSADPVGRIVLHLGRSYNEQTAELSDLVCTGLQLANFCQDAALDYRRGRIYFPREYWQRAGCGARDFAAASASAPLRQLVALEVAEARSRLEKGLPLPKMVDPSLRSPVALFIHGGLAILNAIESADYDVWARRPRLARAAKLAIVLRCWWQIGRGTRP